MWEKEEKASDIEELVSKHLTCLPPAVKAGSQQHSCNATDARPGGKKCDGDVAAWRRDEDVNRGWTYGYPSRSSAAAPWSAEMIWDCSKHKKEWTNVF
jgi:hypothetical protein